MSHFLDRLTFFTKNTETFSGDHGVTTNEDRQWEDGYRKRWSHDKIVRSTHGTNCTGSCSWKIYVKGGIVTWETQQTDYPRTRPDMPNHEPRGCARGASYSWYLYSGNRIKYPLIRSELVKFWRDARKGQTAVEAWKSIVQDPVKLRAYQQARGLGGFVRADWDEVNEIIGAANVYTAKEYGPDRIIGFSPIPAMSMVSYAAGSRYLSLIGGTCMSFYDWYCDLPPASPQVWGEQTDVPESADWYNSTFLMLWGSNVPQTRTPDAHFYTEVRYKGAKSVVVCPDYSEAAKFADTWLAPKQGTDAALAMAMGHVIMKEFHLSGKSEYFREYARKYSDMPFLVRLVKKDGYFVPERFVRASDIKGGLGEENNPEWKTVAYDENTGNLAAPIGTSGYRWGEKGDEGKWNLDPKDSKGNDLKLQLSLIDKHDDVADVEEFLRLHAGQRVHLRAAFNLKHPDGIGLAEHFVGFRFFLRQVFKRVLRAVVLRDQIEAFANAGQHSKAKNIDLQDAERVDIILVPLDHRAVFHSGIFDRAKFIEAALGDDKSANVLRKVARKTDDLVDKAYGLYQAFIFGVKANLADLFFVYWLVRPAPYLP